MCESTFLGNVQNIINNPDEKPGGECCKYVNNNPWSKARNNKNSEHLT